MDDDVARAVLARYGRTYAEEAGIRPADEPAPLFQLLVLAQLLSARIGAGVAVATARELFGAGWTTPATLRNAGRGSVVAALGRGGYRRYDERTATQLREMAALVLTRYAGDLRKLAEAAGREPGRASALVQEVKGIGPTGAAVARRPGPRRGPQARAPRGRDRAGRTRRRRRPRPLRRGPRAGIAAPAGPGSAERLTGLW